MSLHAILSVIAFFSIAAAALALMREVWLHRGQGRHPIVLLVREYFGRRWGSPGPLLAVFLAGLAVSFMPVLAGVMDGRVRVSLNPPRSLPSAALSAANILL